MEDLEKDFLSKNLRENLFNAGFDGFYAELSRFSDACRERALQAIKAVCNQEKLDERCIDISTALYQYYVLEMKPYAYNYYVPIDKGEPRAPIIDKAANDIFAKCNVLKDSIDRSIKAYKAAIASGK